MPRTLYIVAEGTDPANVLAGAQAAEAGEIVVGIPPRLANEVDVADLPTVYVEPDPEVVEPPEPEPDPIESLRSDLDWLINYVVTGEG